MINNLILIFYSNFQVFNFTESPPFRYNNIAEDFFFNINKNTSLNIEIDDQKFNKDIINNRFYRINGSNITISANEDDLQMIYLTLYKDICYSILLTPVTRKNINFKLYSGTDNHIKNLCIINYYENVDFSLDFSISSDIFSSCMILDLNGRSVSCSSYERCSLTTYNGFVVCCNNNGETFHIKGDISSSKSLPIDSDSCQFNNGFHFLSNDTIEVSDFEKDYVCIAEKDYFKWSFYLSLLMLSFYVSCFVILYYVSNGKLKFPNRSINTDNSHRVKAYYVKNCM